MFFSRLFRLAHFFHRRRSRRRFPPGAFLSSFLLLRTRYPLVCDALPSTVAGSDGKSASPTLPPSTDWTGSVVHFFSFCFSCRSTSRWQRPVEWPLERRRAAAESLEVVVVYFVAPGGDVCVAAFLRREEPPPPPPPPRHPPTPDSHHQHRSPCFFFLYIFSSLYSRCLFSSLLHLRLLRFNFQ